MSEELPDFNTDTSFTITRKEAPRSVTRSEIHERQLGTPQKEEELVCYLHDPPKNFKSKSGKATHMRTHSKIVDVLKGDIIRCFIPHQGLDEWDNDNRIWIRGVQMNLPEGFQLLEIIRSDVVKPVSDRTNAVQSFMEVLAVKEGKHV